MVLSRKSHIDRWYCLFSLIAIDDIALDDIDDTLLSVGVFGNMDRYASYVCRCLSA